MTEQYKVYRGVEKPSISRARTRTSKYPFATMEVGDMFFVPKTEAPKTFSSQVTAAGRRLKRKFSVRVVSVEGVVGVGCWYEGHRSTEQEAEEQEAEEQEDEDQTAEEQKAGRKSPSRKARTGKRK